MAERFIPYGRQSVNEADIAAVVEALRSDWLTQGPAVERFEGAMAAYCGARHAVACSSGTAALHLAMLAGGLGPSDTVVTSPITFLASANCAFYVGAQPRFADVDGATANMSPSALSRVLGTIAPGEGRVAVIPVHFAGTPCDIEAISETARGHDALIVEDACHAPGARYRSRDGEWHTVGGCHHSDMAVFSFHPVKHVATGEGGMVTTNDDGLAARLRSYRNHGMTKDPANFKIPEQASEGNEVAPWYYEMQVLGYNLRISDLQCALGAAQMNRLPEFVQRRREIATHYREALADLPHVTPLVEPDGTEGAYHLFVVRVDYEAIGRTRTEVMNALREHGIGTQVHFIPVHLQPYYRERLGTGPSNFPEAEAYYAEALSLPIFPAMTDDDLERVVDGFREACSA